MVKRILAIDPGTKQLGLYDGEQGMTMFADPKKSRPERLAELGLKLVEWLEEQEPYDFVVYEEQFTRGDAATRALYGVVGIIECAAINAGAGVMPLPQGTLRKWAELEDTSGAKGKGLYESLAVTRDPRLMHLPGVTEHVFDAACVYHFIADHGEYKQ